MSPLATEIYRQLLRRARTRQPAITYGELAALVSKRRPIHRRSRAFHTALGEVTLACREHALPCLPAIVWAARRNRPSGGYYEVAHPHARTEGARRAAWEREHAAVIRNLSRYPASL